MNIDQLAALGELVGGLGVLGTLLFLVFEVRRNTRIMRINAQALGMQSFASYNELLATDPELIPLFDRILNGESYSTLNSVDQFRLSVSIRALVQRMEAQFFQYKGGLIDELYWQQRMRWLKGFLTLPTLENWWEMESASAQLTVEFVEHVNSVNNTMKLGRFGQVDIS